MKIILFGIDASTFKLLKPWIKTGKLPTFKKIMKNGTYGILKSIFIPFSFPAWKCMVIGKKPETLDIYSLFEREKNSYKPQMININIQKENPIWKILNKYNKCTYIINVPAIEIDKLKGVFVKGPFSVSKKLVYPISLEKKLKSINYFEYDIPSNTIGEKKFIEICYKIIRKKINLAKKLITKKDWDFFMFSIVLTDPLQHLFWKHTDKKHPLYKKNNKYENVILDFYKIIDSFINFLINNFKKNNIFIVSDHGHDVLFKDIDLNNFLMENGFQSRKKKINFDKNDFVNFLIKSKIYFNLYSKLIKRYPFKLIKNKLKKQLPEYEAVDFIDWKNTYAYSIESRGIRINLKGREPQGIVNREDYKKIIKKIIKKLKNLKDPDTGNYIIKKTIILYRALTSHRRSIPDIFIEYENGYDNMFIGRKFMKSVFNEPLYWSSKHIKEGIFFAFGPNIKNGFNVNANLIDIFPTILHMFNIPIPRDIDGRVLKEIFKPESHIAKRPLKYENKLIEDKEIKNILKKIDI